MLANVNSVINIALIVATDYITTKRQDVLDIVAKHIVDQDTSLLIYIYIYIVYALYKMLFVYLLSNI